LKDKSIWDGSEPLNVSIKAIKDEDGKGGRIIITGAPSLAKTLHCSNLCLDTGIGMSTEELTTNLVRLKDCPH
jgi:heat shock protein beta